MKRKEYMAPTMTIMSVTEHTFLLEGSTDEVFARHHQLEIEEDWDAEDDTDTEITVRGNLWDTVW